MGEGGDVGGSTEITAGCMYIHVLMRDERRKKERSKQRQTNKQGKATCTCILKCRLYMYVEYGTGKCTRLLRAEI